MPERLKPKLRDDVTLIVFDFDGVLTDNRVWVLDDGKEAIVCNRSDGLGFDLFRKNCIPVLIMSTEVNPVVSARASKLKTSVLQAVESKKRSLIDYCDDHDIDLGQVMFVGNDINDLEAMELVGFPVAPADADDRIVAIAWRVTKAKGGMGVAREIAESILELDYFDR